MFEKLKQLKQINDLKDALGKERREVEKEGVKVVVNGKMEIEEIRLNPQLDDEQQGKVIKDCLNEAMKQVQAEVARRMFQM
ncbi:MAG: YbaB/EbfC family nucleoid-associated protein [bacterium]|nr:YbaB/EbfC family nucleoid-associated protein [bacterium]